MGKHLLTAAIAIAALAGCGTTTPPSSAPTSTAASPSASVKPTPVPATTRPSTDFGNATFHVPEFTGYWNTCTAGTRTFKNGYALIKDNGSNKTGISINERVPAVVGDIDGQPGDEAVIMLHCATEGASPFTPFVIKLDASGKVAGSLGFVLQIPGKPFIVSEEEKPVSIVDGVIKVDVFGEYGNQGPKRTVSYAYRDGKFVQVS